MRGLTLWQPWASAIADGHKTIENRSWRPGGLRGRIAIHAGRFYDRDGEVFCAARGAVYTADAVPRGAIVATAVVADVLTESDDPWFMGPFGWRLTDVKRLAEPIACRGFQQLWTVPGHIERALAMRGVL